MPGEFASLLPAGNTTVWEKAVEQASGERWGAIDVDIVRRARDPETCPPHLLNFLAFDRSVDLWNPEWSTEKKRAIIAQSIALHRLKGTDEGIRRYVGLTGAEVLQVKTPPEGVFLSDEPTKAEMDAYYDRLPEIRIHLANNTGAADIGLYADDGFLDDTGFLPDAGSVLYGRRATLHRNGAETPLTLWGLGPGERQGTAREIERIAVPGGAGAALCLDTGFLDDGICDRTAVTAQLVTLELDVTYSHPASKLWVTPVTPGLDPVNPRYERDSETGDGSAALFAGTFLDDDFLVDDADLLYDRLRLFDPAVEGPLRRGDSYLDDARIDMAAYTAEIMIDAPRAAPAGEGFADGCFFGDFGLVDDDLTLPNAALDAVAASMALRDTVLATFHTTRPVTFGDRPQWGVSFDARTRRYL